MKIHGINELTLAQSIVTIGAFDGIHLGHQTLINKAKSRAEFFNIPLVVYTFDPPPKVYFQKADILTSLPEKKQFLEALGVCHTIFAPFNEKYASRSVEEFIEELASINPQEIWVGPDFQFGNGKTGTIEDLDRAFTAYQHPVVLCQRGERISSTRIRNLFQSEEIEQANNLLGRNDVVIENV